MSGGGPPVTRSASREGGFTLVELLVGLAIFGLVSGGFYQVLFSARRGSQASRSVARVSEEARLGLNRIVRDTREAYRLVSASPTSYRVYIDFDGDGVPSNPNSRGDYEDLTFTFSGTQIMLNGEVLVTEVACTRKPDGSCRDVFSFISSKLEYDWNFDGVTTYQELLDAPSKGVNLDANAETTSVLYSLRVTAGDRASDFFAEAQMRNKR